MFNFWPGFITFVVISLVLFLLGREIVCWYFKINKIVELLETLVKNTQPKESKTETVQNNILDHKIIS